MEGFEILSRASAFLVRADTKFMNKNRRSAFPIAHSSTYAARAADKSGLSFFPSHHIVTSSHVVSPWKWPRYYPEEWLQFVTEEHTHYTLEIRDDTGVFISQVECNPVTYHHANKDLAVLHLADEQENLSLLEDIGYEHIDLLAPRKSKGLAVQGVLLDFYGHNVSGGNKSEGHSNFQSPSANPKKQENADDRLPVPLRVDGEIVHRTSEQIFCKTSSVLTDGMCGGPVVMTSEGEDQKASRICGMVEGIVPVDHPVEALQGLAVFIESDDIRDFLKDIEEDKVDPLLGGQSVDHVGTVNKDPDRDLHNLQP